MDVSRNSVAVVDGAVDAVTGSIPGQAQTLTYSIKNSGNAVLTVGSFALSTTTNCTASVTTQPSASVAAGQSNNFVVSVTPTAQGAWSCNISGSSNDADENPYNWTIQGTAQSGSTALVVTSSTFVNGGTIPVRCSYTGGNKSPALTWAGAPSSALSFVVIMDDLDADFWVHWNVFKIPSATTSLPEGGPLPTGAVPGKSTGGETGYEGVDPPSGTHRYTIAVYALSIANIQVPTTAKTRSAFQTEFGSYIVAKGEITGFYTAGTNPAPTTAGTNN
jgi:Raf kinase inhibitor-like YbhB/YbcL family protein